MQVTVSSTTDSKEQIAAAAGNLKTDSVEQKSAPANEQGESLTKDSETLAATEGDESLPTDGDDSKESNEDDQDKEEKPKKKGGFKKRIDKLNSKLSAKEQEAAYWRNEALKHQSQVRTEEKPSVSKADPSKPVADSFDSHDDYIDALTDWKVDQKIQAREAKQNEAQLKSKFEEKVSTHVERVKSFSESHDDFNDLMEEVDDVPMSLTVQEVILQSEMGPELMYELAKNKKEYQRICSLPAIAAARELGKIEARLQKTEEPKEIKKTKAPPPISPVGSRSSKSSYKSPDEMEFQEYKRWREEHPNG